MLPRALLAAVLQILVRDREHRICLDLDVPHQALPLVAIADLGVVESRFDARNTQPFVMINFLVLVVQSLVRSPGVLGDRRKLKTGNSRGGQVPESDALAAALW